MKQSPWSWIASLFAAEEIPAAMITYVALLMFIQIGTTPALAVCLCGCLFLPWVLKSFLRARIRRTGRFRRVLQSLELGMALCLAVMSLLLYPRMGWSVGASNRPFALYVVLFLLSLLTAWHELAARMYYERMLYPRAQRLFNGPKMFFSQGAVVLTYGAMIMLVGALQVIYRNIFRAWSDACLLSALVLLLFFLYHLIILRSPRVGDRHLHTLPFAAVRAEMKVIDRIRHKEHWLETVVALALVLLPQSLMFYSRVLFLLAPSAKGGLECTIQEVGFAQGTIGVIAFSVGIVMGRQLLQWAGAQKALWWMVISLGLSPFVYMMMTIDPPSSLGVLCIATFQAQFFFGFGLNICMHLVRYVSGERYRNTINYLYVPVISAVMFVPMCMSGWLVDVMGYRMFFMLDACTALLAWWYVRRKRNLIL